MWLMRPHVQAHQEHAERARLESGFNGAPDVRAIAPISALLVSLYAPGALIDLGTLRRGLVVEVA